MILSWLLALLLIIGCRLAASAEYYRGEAEEGWLEDDSTESPEESLWTASGSSEADEGQRSRPPPSLLFKRFAELGSPGEQWPSALYDQVLSICNDGTRPGKVYKSQGEGNCPHGTIAVGRYHNAQNETGWGILEVQTFASYPDQLQAYAAGLAEGLLTKVQIKYHYKNTVDGLCTNATAYCKKLYRYLDKNLEWIGAQVRKQPSSDLYWRQVNLTFAQLTGLNDGYNAEKASGYIARTDFRNTPVYMLQLSGELIDLEHVFKKKRSFADDPEPGKCSGFVKVTDGNEDLLTSHVAMSGYNTMNRVVKLYKLGYDPKQVPGYAVSFSGYAGVLASADDYTLTSGGLLSVETTISVFNESLYQNYVQPEGQLHCWLRSFISNQLASTAHDWVRLFARYNSGTYNNQWTVVDYKLFKPKQTLPETDLVWILEQVPGFTVSRDVTWFLRKYGYWPSYNIPFLRKISELSGFDVKGNMNNWWRWGYSPRAKIFQRDHGKVHNIETLRELMRYNNYQHDEFARCICTPPYTAEGGISARGDLNPAKGHYELPGMGHRNHGALDYKGTNYEMFKQLRLELVGGPTYGGPGNLPYFSWNTTDIVSPHFGQPTVWKFPPFATLWVTAVSADMGREEAN